MLDLIADLGATMFDTDPETAEPISPANPSRVAAVASTPMSTTRGNQQGNEGASRANEKSSPPDMVIGV